MVIYEAPTGYGKTSISPVIGNELIELGIAGGYIHVLPMRSIVSDLYQRLISGKTLFNKIIDPRDVSYQASGLMLSGKNPYMSRKYNITTIDSFMLNLVRYGLGGSSGAKRHYEASRSMIFTSMIILDEAHLYGGDPGSPENILFTSLVAALESSLYSMSPVLITTATLPRSLGEILYSRAKTAVHKLGGRVLWLRYGERIHDSIGEINTLALDESYDEEVISTLWETHLYSSEEQWLKTIMEKASTGKTLIVVNTPSKAIRLYWLLTNTGFQPILIHGRLTIHDREKAEKNLENAQILVSTQVVESGVDIDFNYLFTDIAPVSNLIQRAGRVNRRLRGGVVGEVHVYTGGYIGVYDKRIVELTAHSISHILEKHGSGGINWKLARCPDNKCIGYMDLLDNVYSTTLRSSFELSEYSMLLDLIIHPLMKHEDTVKYAYVRCLHGRGIVRSSILLTLYPLPCKGTFSEEEVSGNAIPVSLSWVLKYSSYLLKDADVLLAEKNGEVTSLPLNQYMDSNNYMKTLCGLLTYGYKDEEEKVFLGLRINPTYYSSGLGLLVGVYPR